MDKRNVVVASLGVYADFWLSHPYQTLDPAEEKSQISELKDFISLEPACFSRHTREGHLTASAMVVSPDFSQVLLTLHAKLGKWLQLGGHTDEGEELADAALREAREEAGQPEAQLYPWQNHYPQFNFGGTLMPFDCDIHTIPARGQEPTHRHFDVRFIVELDPKLPIAITPESKDLRWFSLKDAFKLTDERSMHRQFWKIKTVAQQRQI